MLKKKKNYLIVVILFFFIFFAVGGPLINKYYNEYVMSCPQMYCYNDFYNKDNPLSVVILQKLKYKDFYVDYYRKVENKESPSYHPYLSIKGMPVYSPVYVLKYTEDSTLAKVVSYYNRGAQFGGSFTIGWVYARALHSSPAPPRKEEELRDSYFW